MRTSYRQVVFCASIVVFIANLTLLADAPPEDPPPPPSPIPGTDVPDYECIDAMLVTRFWGNCGAPDPEIGWSCFGDGCGDEESQTIMQAFCSSKRYITCNITTNKPTRLTPLVGHYECRPRDIGETPPPGYEDCVCIFIADSPPIGAPIDVQDCYRP